MTRNTKILIAAGLVIIIAAGVWFYFSTSTPTATDTSTAAGSPFGVAPANTAGGTGDITGSNINTNPITTTNTGTTTVPVLFKISSSPVAGAVIFLKNKVETIRYVDRATGHIFEVDPLTLSQTQIVNNTAPKIYQAVWKPDGSTVIMRSLVEGSDTILNTALTLSAPKSTSSDALYGVSATQLRGALGVIVPSTNSIAYTTSDTGVIAISSFLGDKASSLYSSAFKEWQLAWGGGNLVVTSSASITADGYAYTLNTKTGGLSRLLGPLTALTSLISTDAAHIAYSYIDGQSSVFAIETIKNGSVENLSLATLPEKCAWSTKQKNIILCGIPTSGVGSNQPDNWYQGLNHFSDNIWSINADSGLTILLAEPKKQFNVDLDIINPEISPNEDYLIFMNKTDLSLWALKLSH